MRKFRVIVNNISIGGVTHSFGKELSEDQFKPGVADVLKNRGKLQEITNQRVIKEGEKIKLAIVTSIWKRMNIVELFFEGIEKLRKTCPNFEIIVIVSGSIQDDKDSFADIGFSFNKFINWKPSYLRYIEIPNDPLAAKVNATTYACKKLGVDYVLCMGSDDIISPELLNEYAQFMRKGIDFIGVTDCYFYDTVSKKSLYWGGYREPYRKGHTTGAFRALSARLLSQWDWMPWENKDSHVLDKSMQDKLKVTPHTIHTFSMKEKGLFALDIKSSTNMTPFAKWDNAEFIDTEIIKKQFPYVFD